MSGDDQGRGSGDSPNAASNARADMAVKMARWAEAIDQMDYFQLFELPRATSLATWPTEEVVRRAFGNFAGRFHPDRFATVDDATKAHANTVFRRANEALRVLLHPSLRSLYLQALATGKKRLSPDLIARESSQKMQAVRVPIASETDVTKESFESLVTVASALPFARQADLMMLKGEPKKAILQAQIAVSKEMSNVRLMTKLHGLMVKHGVR